MTSHLVNHLDTQKDSAFLANVAAIINRCRRFTSANNENHYYHNETMIPLLPAITLQYHAIFKTANRSQACEKELKPLPLIHRVASLRGPTHVFTHWMIAAIAFTFIWDYHGILAAFAWGGVSHILTDAMTVSGVPFSPYSDRRFHLFGGRFRTGDPVEYAISAGVIIAAIGFNHITGGQGFAPLILRLGRIIQPRCD